MKATCYLFLGMLSVLFFSCQKEENVVIDDTTQNLVNTSPLTNLISRVSQNATSNDNVLDGSSCFSVQLPVTVFLNGTEVVVATEADYQAVQDAIDAFNDDDDIVNFIYPITIQYQNFTTQVLNNSEDLEDVLEDCGEDDDFDEIDCITLNYPIVINIYDSNSQLANTITITNNAQLYNFLENLDDNEYVAINYPISLVNSNGNIVVITSNNQFEDVIEEAIDDCDDDSSGGGSGGGSIAFTDVISSGTWYVSYFFDNSDETSDYNGYNFTFSSSGSVIAVKSGVTINGNWSNYIDSGENKLELSFDGASLDELEEDWEITEFSSTVIKLKDVSGGGGGTDYLYFTKN
jgi:hypothetical protein